MAYDPPTSPLSFNFDAGSYTPLTSPLTINFVEGNSQSITPSGVAPSSVPEPASVYNLTQIVSASGLSSLSVGSHVVAADQYVNTSGFSPLAIGNVQFSYTQVVSSLGVAGTVPAPRALRQLSFNFQDGGYAPPAPLDFDFLGNSSGIFPSGISSAEIGTAFIAHENRQILPAGVMVLGIGGFDSVYTKTIQVFANVPFSAGTPTVYNYNKLINAIGLLSQVITQPTIYNETPSVSPSGPLTQQLGTPTVMNHRLEVVPSGFNAIGIGSHGVSNSPHFIFNVGVTHTAIGAPAFYGGTKYVTVINQFTETIGSHFVAYANREIPVIGVSSLQMTSDHLVRDSLQTVYARPVTGDIGFAAVRNLNREIVIDGGPRGIVERPVVYNANQYIRMLTPFPPDGLQKPGDPAVYNFDKEIRAYGVAELNVYPTHTFIRYQNWIVPDGITGVVGDHRVRNNDYYHPLDGVDSLLIGNQQAHNTSFGVYASAGDTAEVGAHNVAKTLYRLVDGVFDSAVGASWVSHSPRAIDLYERGVDSQQYGTPFVGNDPQVFYPSGVPSAYVGFQVFYRHLLVLNLGAVSTPGYGSPTVFNFDRDIEPFGFLAHGIGAPSFENSTRHLVPDGISSLGIGTHRVMDQTQRINCFGGAWIPILDTVPLPLLYKVPGDPPDTQVIRTLDPPIDSAVVGLPDFSKNRIYWGPVSSPTFTEAVGTPAVRTNTVIVTGIHLDLTADTLHTIVFDQVVAPLGVEPLDAIPSWSKHDMQHRTIWCTEDVTPQISANHAGNWHKVDFLDVPKPLPGTPMISNFNRIVTQIDSPNTGEFGSPLFYTYNGYIRPPGVAPPRAASPKFFAGGNVYLQGGIFSEEFGEPEVDAYIAPGTPRDIEPAGISSLRVGEHRISNFNQHLGVTGVSALQISNGQTPFTPQFNLPYPPFRFTGVGTGDVGEPFISNFIREIFPRGADSLDMWEDPAAFSRRMRVYGVARPTISAGNTAQVGSPWVSSGVQAIIDGGTSVLVIPGPVLGLQLDSVGGGGAFATLGDVRIDLVEEGTAKAYGIHPNQVPAPEFFRAIAVSGIGGSVGVVLFGDSVSASGIDSHDDGAHVFTLGDNTLHSCGMATRAIAVGGVAPAPVPEPALT